MKLIAENGATSMLVITRRPEEYITIGDDIKIMVVRVKGQYVRIGIECPKDMIVIRSGGPKERAPLQYDDNFSSEELKVDVEKAIAALVKMNASNRSE